MAPVHIILTPEQQNESFEALDRAFRELEAKGWSMPEIECGFVAFLANWAVTQIDPRAALDSMTKALGLWVDEGIRLKALYPYPPAP